MVTRKGGHGRFTCDPKLLRKKLAELYSRRSAVENLIRCLESYAACQTKNEGRVRLKRA